MLLYYHSYSGAFESSVKAVQDNLVFIRTQPYIAVKTSKFIDIGKGFFTTKFQKLGKNTWKVIDRGELDTIRFDEAKSLEVDLAKSNGVLGFKEFQGSLYVALDPSFADSIITLREKNNHKQRPYLIESTWEVANVQFGSRGVSFDSIGWGKLLMRWQMPNGKYQVKGENIDLQIEAKDGVMEFSYEPPNYTSIKLEIEKL